MFYPPQYDPRISPIYALNEIDGRAPAEVEWKLLVDAEHCLITSRPRTRSGS